MTLSFDLVYLTVLGCKLNVLSCACEGCKKGKGEWGVWGEYITGRVKGESRKHRPKSKPHRGKLDGDCTLWEISA